MYKAPFFQFVFLHRENNLFTLHLQSYLLREEGADDGIRSADQHVAGPNASAEEDLLPSGAAAVLRRVFQQWTLFVGDILRGPRIEGNLFTL